MTRLDRARLFLAAATALGVGCGGTPRAAQPDVTSDAPRQEIDGEARCGVGTSEEQAQQPSNTPPSS